MGFAVVLKSIQLKGGGDGTRSSDVASKGACAPDLTTCRQQQGLNTIVHGSHCFKVPSTPNPPWQAGTGSGKKPCQFGVCGGSCLPVLLQVFLQVCLPNSSSVESTAQR